MSEFEIKKELEEKRKHIDNQKDLFEYLKDVEKNYNCGYGESARAVAQAMLATGWYFSNVFGLTGFQASCLIWDVIRDWQFSSNKCGLKIVDFDNMLYPQYEEKFEKTITKSVWEQLQKEANVRLAQRNYAHPDVKEHWKKIVNGIVPFGYTVVDD